MARILVVDDNAMNAELVRRLLELEGYTVDVAEDGARALISAWTQHPDLIIMDLSMPVFDGWAATRQLKAAPETRPIPILALTAHAMAGDRERSLVAGCDDYDTKPVDSTRLLGKVTALLAAHPLAGSSTSNS